ncbi:MBL fold metallo-hydrolase [Lysinibacillus fusiformis]|nr:MBL fold metallo-hydrolase [Lysinibacillus fusiformis]
MKRCATTGTKQLFSLNTQQAAGDIRNNAENITNKPVSWVINSHFHSDHT